MGRIVSKLHSVLELTVNLWESVSLSRTKLKQSGISETKRQIPVVVSLTSYPGRIHVVHKTIKTILNQTMRPDKVILWLAEEQFPNKDIPQELQMLKAYGLEIMWCEDIRSYKKLIPTLKLYPNAVIVTADDDNYYSRNWLEKLYHSYEQNPDCVSAHKVTMFTMENDKWSWKAGGREYYRFPSYLNKLVGVGGVLYPPHCLYLDICNADLFRKLAPTNDDQWFWMMAILAGTKIKVVDDPIIHGKPVEGTLSSGLWKENDQGEGLFEKQFHALVEYYPEVEKRMKDELSLPERKI